MLELKHFNVLWLRGRTSHSCTALEAATDHAGVNARTVLCGLLGMAELRCTAGMFLMEMFLRKECSMLYASLFTGQSGGWWLKHRCTEIIGHLDTFRILAVFMVFDCLFSFLPLFSFPLTGRLRI